MEDDFRVTDDVMLEDLGDYEIEDEVVEAPAHEDVVLTDAQRNIALQKLARDGRRYGESASKKFIQVLEALADLEKLVPARARRVAILEHDWLYSKTYAKRLVSLPTCDAETLEILGKNLPSVETIVAYLKAPVAIRTQIEILWSEGLRVNENDIRYMRQQRREGDQKYRIARALRAVEKVATDASRRQFADFKQEVHAFVESAKQAYQFAISSAGTSMNDEEHDFPRRAARLFDRFNDFYPDVEESSCFAWDEQYGYFYPNAGPLPSLKKTLGVLASKGFGYFYNPSYYMVVELDTIRELAFLGGNDVSDLDYYREPEYSDYYDDDEEENCSSLNRWIDHEGPEPEPLKSLEICAGAGGEAIGLHAAGFEPLGIYERDSAAVATLRRNLDLGPVFEADVRHTDFSIYRGKVDLFAGGVPCQPFSAAGLQRGREDERDLFSVALDIVETVRPRAVMLENVDGFRSKRHILYRADIFDRLKELGYEGRLFPIAASDYGLAQLRPRVVLIAFRDGLMSKFRMPPILTPTPVTLGEQLLDLVSENGWQYAKKWAKRASRPGFTLTGASDKVGRGGFSMNVRKEDWSALGIDSTEIAQKAPAEDHGNKPFQLTLRMGARLQNFPDGYDFGDNIDEARRQIANAFPPILAKAVGLAIRAVLQDRSIDYAWELSPERFWTMKTPIMSPTAASLKASEGLLRLPGAK